MGVAWGCTKCSCTPSQEKKNLGPNLHGKVVSAPPGRACTAHAGSARVEFFEEIAEIWTVGVVYSVILACVLRATTNKRSSTFWGKKSAPQRKSWPRLWVALPRIEAQGHFYSSLSPLLLTALPFPSPSGALSLSPPKHPQFQIERPTTNSGQNNGTCDRKSVSLRKNETWWRGETRDYVVARKRTKFMESIFCISGTFVCMELCFQFSEIDWLNCDFSNAV